MQHDALQASVYIGISTNVQILLDDDNTLWIAEFNSEDKTWTYVRIYEGKITKSRIDFLVECLQRMKTFAD